MKIATAMPSRSSAKRTLMASAKDLIVKPILASDANRIVKQLHYSGKVVQNSKLHLGVFLNGRCGGAMSFGPSTDKRRILRLVDGALWNDFLELNRMAFADWLPRNGESRCIGYAIRWIRKTYPHIKWVVSFADATQCGDGAIYRASGFVLTAIKKNNQILQMPDGTITNKKTLDNPNHMAPDGRFGSALARELGAKPLPGFQLRYIYFIDQAARERLTVPIIPFSEINRRGASMYRGKTRVTSTDSGVPDNQSGGGGASPTVTLSIPASTPNGKTRTTARADDTEDSQRQPRKAAAKQARAKARK